MNAIRTSRKDSQVPTFLGDKLLPMAVELEDAVIGVCMLERYLFEQVVTKLKPEMLYSLQNRLIYSAMYDLNLRGIPIDILTVVQELNDTGKLESVGGPYAVTKKTNAVVGSGNLEAHIRIIQQKYINRELIKVSLKTANDAYADNDCFNNCDNIQASIERILSELGISNVYKLSDKGKDILELMDKRRATQTDITGVPSGFEEIDEVTHGWQPTDLIILAARPSVGKTAFALNLARNAAKKDFPVGVFSLEMSVLQLVERIVSAETDVPMNQIQVGKINDEEYSHISRTVYKMEKLPIYIDDTGGLNVLDFRNKAKMMIRDYGVKLVIIDYLQLMYGIQDGVKRNREQEISQISRELKKFAKEMGVPVIALSQLSRAVETRGNASKMPQLSDLRESGAIEQDADVVMFLYRPEYYDVNVNEMGESTRGETHIRIAKHRNGSLGLVTLIARLAIQRFYSKNSMELIKEKIREENDKYNFF